MGEQLLITICGGFILIAFTEALLLVKAHRQNADIKTKNSELTQKIAKMEESHLDTLRAIKERHNEEAEGKNEIIDKLSKIVHKEGEPKTVYIPISERRKGAGGGDIIFRA
jgi:hypothetical protein